MITSMNKADLYRTIFGFSDDHNPYIKKTKITVDIPDHPSAPAPDKINWRTIGETAKPSETVTPANMDTFTYSDDVKVNYGDFSGLSFKRNTDRLELSDAEKAALEDQDFEPYECSEVLVFDPSHGYFYTKLESRIKGCIPTEERIADIYGNMAKRLDAAYAEGKFTKEEYDELNKRIADGMDHEISCSEEKKALRYVLAKRYNAPYKQSIERIRRVNAMTPEEYQAELQAEIASCISRFSYDRGAIQKMFNSIRYGK